MPNYSGIPSQEDEMRAVRRAMKKAPKPKAQKTLAPPAASEEIAPGQYREGIPEGLSDPGVRLANARKRARRAKIAAIRVEA